MSDKAITQGTHHVGLTVPNIEKTGAFFVDTLGFEQVGDMRDYPAVFLTDGTTMVTLWQAEDPATAVPFDRKNVIGLHHFALKVSSAEALTDAHAKLQSAEDVELEFAPESLGGGLSQHLMCTIPGGIRMELIAPAG